MKLLEIYNTTNHHPGVRTLCVRLLETLPFQVGRLSPRTGALRTLLWVHWCRKDIHKLISIASGSFRGGELLEEFVYCISQLIWILDWSPFRQTRSASAMYLRTVPYWGESCYPVSDTLVLTFCILRTNQNSSVVVLILDSTLRVCSKSKSVWSPPLFILHTASPKSSRGILPLLPPPQVILIDRRAFSLWRAP